MKALLFLFSLYALVIAFGINTSVAQDTIDAECVTADCDPANLADDAQVESLVRDVEVLLKKIEDKISVEKLHAIIKQAAEENPQVRELLEIVQGYGVLTEIKLAEQTPEPLEE